MKNHLRPYKSESLALTGIAIVEHNIYVVATHGYRLNPERLAMIRGSAVPTIVWSSAASNIVSISPSSVPTSCGFVSRTNPDV